MELVEVGEEGEVFVEAICRSRSRGRGRFDCAGCRRRWQWRGFAEAGEDEREDTSSGRGVGGLASSAGGRGCA